MSFSYHEVFILGGTKTSSLWAVSVRAFSRRGFVVLVYVRREIVRGASCSAEFTKVVLCCSEYIFVSKNRLFAAAAAGRLGSFILPGYTHTLCSSKQISPFMSKNANHPDECLLLESNQ